MDIKILSIMSYSSFKVADEHDIYRLSRTSHLGKTSKYVFGAYVAIGMATAAFGTYNDGKAALLNFRETETDRNKDWIKVKEKCSVNLWGNALEGIVWPLTIFSKIVPSMVIRFNPPDNSKDSKDSK